MPDAYEELVTPTSVAHQGYAFAVAHSTGFVVFGNDNVLWRLWQHLDSKKSELQLLCPKMSKKVKQALHGILQRRSTERRNPEDLHQGNQISETHGRHQTDLHKHNIEAFSLSVKSTSFEQKSLH